ncbi:molybdenum cofactor biosynthesis protein MoeB [Reticulibacter mediterranei]|uniref:Molybdenum cofactor biosynthesis protein MoeB n=1 Tax=Reticulibacter mediterranei TaxID=2778369 RepID=A0A8J3IFV2_9CHLR|nr:molybdopterin-synthase adenylyltransferase MoeB [Reticulibacter mediterranei]GHO94649.1 molybdenum cofactor biosynthesis protein MoeB [Reticulibacter mediterranei]
MSRTDQADLSQAEIVRYSRHLIMPEVGMDGQRKLKQASVLLIGAGGLGSPLALYLAAAGVGRLGLVDLDVVDESNLQRQILHSTEMVGHSKLTSARSRIEALNPFVQVETYETRLTSENALEILPSYDVVIDGTDNFQTRYLTNDACILLGKPYIYGSIFRFEGQASVFGMDDGPCYRCLYPEPPPPGLMPSCAEGGVLGVLPGMIGLIQATEAIKVIIGQGQLLVGRLLLFDALHMRFREATIRKSPHCPVCGPTPTITHLIDYDQFCSRGPQQDVLAAEERVLPTTLAQEIREGRSLVLIDVREPHEWQICHLPQARLLPQGSLISHLHELEKQTDIVVYCRSGVRSAKAMRLLKDAGFRHVRNLEGGILRWAQEIDPQMPTY